MLCFALSWGFAKLRCGIKMTADLVYELTSHEEMSGGGLRSRQKNADI
jgi:hypothetical protein